jgi:predicted metal-dependent HD superfamily phosphohydrolase
MTVLIDPPAWPAHGTVFSHLVSDDSLEELHAFAAAAGISRRAFDLDHYDVPAHRYEELLAQGAVAVSGRELVRALVRSGLRVPSRRRPRRRDPMLLRRWENLFPAADGAGPHAASADPAAVEALGRELLARWSEPHRNYHAPDHLLAVLEAVDALDAGGEDLGALPRTVRLAAWFHDAVYAADPTRPAGQDEEDSARLAEDLLADPGLAVPDREIEETARLVRLTLQHRPEPEDAAGAVLSDADLEVLGRAPEGYDAYVRLVRADFAHVAEPDWRAGRSAVLASLLERQMLYTTAGGRRRWEEQARENLARELGALG